MYALQQKLQAAEAKRAQAYRAAQRLCGSVATRNGRRARLMGAWQLLCLESQARRLERAVVARKRAEQAARVAAGAVPPPGVVA